jgi:DNA repair/transcription protein MET18/MMS19
MPPYEPNVCCLVEIYFHLLTRVAIAYLAAVLGALAPDTLTRQQGSSSIASLIWSSLTLYLVSVVRQFLCDRIEDATGLKESAQGLTALEKCKRFTGEDAQAVVRS